MQRSTGFQLSTSTWLMELGTFVALFSPILVSAQSTTGQGGSNEEPRDPLAITLLKMDLDGASDLLRGNDLDDDGSLSRNEWERMGWDQTATKRFDVDRDTRLQHLEIALKLADERLDAGIVQMDSVLADRYTQQYDSNRDGKLHLQELERNTFSDQIHTYDKNSDDTLTRKELILGLAWERKFRDELGIKGCDQGGAMKVIARGDMNHDRRIDADELANAQLDAQAMKFDRNEDGKLSVSELAEKLAVRRRKLGLTPSDQLAARQLLRRLGRSEDGQIDAKAFPETSGEWNLRQSDSNEDGMVSEVELETYFGQRRKSLDYVDEDESRAKTLIQRNDANGSGSLSNSELQASGADRSSPLWPDRMPLIDQDGDGEVTLPELARHLHKTQSLLSR